MPRSDVWSNLVCVHVLLIAVIEEKEEEEVVGCMGAMCLPQLIANHLSSHTAAVVLSKLPVSLKPLPLKVTVLLQSTVVKINVQR